MIAYKLMTIAIRQGRYSKADLTRKANVFFMAGQMSDEEYAEIMEKIENLS